MLRLIYRATLQLTMMKQRKWLLTQRRLVLDTNLPMKGLGQGRH